MKITVKAGICVYGPFSISEKYQLASDFVVIVADGTFSGPVQVQMEHCLYMPEYKKCMEVVILRADHLSITEDGLYTFDYFTNPELFPEHPNLSYETSSFCIICNALDQESSQLVSKPSIDDNPSSFPSSLDESNESHAEFPSHLSKLTSTAGHCLSGSRLCQDFDTENLQQVESVTLENTTLSQKNGNLKRKQFGKKIAHKHESGCVKKFCQIEYSALIFQPQKKVVNSLFNYYKFAIFISLNCPGAHKVSYFIIIIHIVDVYSWLYQKHTPTHNFSDLYDACTRNSGDRSCHDPCAYHL